MNLSPSIGQRDAGSTPRDRAVVALGSNLGNSTQIIHQAIARLETLSSEPLLKSSLWQTSPVDCPPGSPPFVNAVVVLQPQTGETPETLLEKLQALETEFGRRRSGVPNEPRPLDLDLIAFGPEQRQSERLILPHPRAHLRRFVLEPLNEIAPELVLPGQAKTIRQLLVDLQTPERLTRLSWTKVCSLWD